MKITNFINLWPAFVEINSNISYKYPEEDAYILLYEENKINV